MTDREKIVNGLLEVKDNINCPSGWKKARLMDIVDKAIALLIEQEPVEPIKVKGYNPPMYTLYEYECRECKSPMMNKQPYCMGCGRSVKWE